jgi:hypothetical protein
LKAREHGREVHVAANAAAADAPGRSAAAAEADSAAAGGAEAAAAAAAEVELREEASVAVGRVAGRRDERAAAAEGSTKPGKAAAAEDAPRLRGLLGEGAGGAEAAAAAAEVGLLREEHEGLGLGELLGAELRHGAAAGVGYGLVAGGAGLDGVIGRAHAGCGRTQAPRNLKRVCVGARHR